jgi:hypothetical protein
MNERIKSLIERAEYQALKQSGSDWEVHVEPSREQIFEKFAELIVNECVRVMYDNAIERKVPPDIDKTPLQYAIAIKEHFGVEE